MNQWFIYLVRSRLGHLYTGITTDVERRLREHAAGVLGARSLRGKAPLTLVFSAPAGDRSRASRLEAAIKKLDRASKERLIAGQLPLESLLGVLAEAEVFAEDAKKGEGQKKYL